MLREIWDLIRELLGRIFSSRLFALAIAFTALFSVLIVQLFQLQILHGNDYLQQYQERILAESTTAGTRGNIYDRDGKLLAYNALQYNITITDTDSFDTTDSGINKRNRMLKRLAEIVEKYQYPLKGQYKISMDSDGNFSFTTSSEAERRRFIAQAYGRNEEDLPESTFSQDAEAIFNYSKKRYNFDKMKDDNGDPMIPSNSTLLDMINILYTMRLTAYQKYLSTTIVENISSECMAEIEESRGELPGVEVASVSVRKYNYAPYLSHIVGYTGQVREDQLKELQKTDESYAANDTVGVWGLEKSEESVLKGQKGHRTMYLNSVGSIIEVVSETEAKSGNDIYTTISADDQIAIYHLLEQELAGILVSKITENDDVDTENVKQSQIMIPLKDAYFQLINNNVLDRTHFSAADAGTAEKRIATLFVSDKESKLAEIRSMLENGGGTLKELPQDMQAFVVYIYDYLTGKSSGIIDTENQSYRESEAYTAWKNDSISLHDFILAGISESWLDTSRLELETEYSDVESIYGLFIDKLMTQLAADQDFEKSLYKYAIADKTIPGYLLLMALFEQGVLQPDSAAYQQLSTGDAHYAYTFLIDKIRRIELTPAQLALDPCNGSVTVTDVNTGKVKALVTYPGFDNNRISDPDYLKKCNADLSLPLLNSATQTQLAPGSTFKPITSVAALEEGVITTDTVIDCTGKYEEVSPAIRCWIWPSAHGEENIVDGIMNSCNFFFADLGHRLSMDADGNYDQETGLTRIKKYASLFGLDEKSGVEIDEAEPRISDSDPERSAMGQGTHAYNNVQLSRYITAVANGGTLYKLSILDKVTDAEGNVIESIEPEAERELSFSQVTWNAVHTGLRKVITDGVAKRVFAGQDITVAGKTGTAQEREDRGNHAVFVSYAPAENPEISVTVNISYGYSSGNAASLANQVYNYCFGKTTLDQILSQDASYVSAVNVSD